ncbi:MAG: sodium:proton antiporter [Propionibacteriaceae bacterium]|nr:sodium:proton antiporter [Propionibacteriaceae bacterium]
MIAWWMAVPFVAMLLAIAVLPLVRATRDWWDNPGHQLLVALILSAPVCVALVVTGHPSSVVHALVEYGQFIVLLFGLFVVAGGIAVTGNLAGTPKTNTLILAVGACLASLIGTTGAAMLLIRVLLISNKGRRHRTHTVVFAIFVMANCGGLLTPLGDPPLFLGMLRGVPFTWTLGLWPDWLFVNALLLVTYFCLDSALSGSAGHCGDPNPTSTDQGPTGTRSVGVAGLPNIVWFAAIVAAVAVVPSVGTPGMRGWAGFVPWRELCILAAAGLSWITSRQQVRFTINHFTFAPIKEVAAVFVGIFVTMAPAFLLLDEHAGSLRLNTVSMHVLTGGLSSILDNAPTYATFFEVAQSSAGSGITLVAGVPEALLVAISTGAVFWGAMTYIGNGPNFLVRSVAVHQSVPMPAFLGYIGWSARWLLPVLASYTLVFLASSWWARLVGLVLGVLVLVRAGLIWRRSRWIRLPGSPEPPAVSEA